MTSEGGDTAHLAGRSSVDGCERVAHRPPEAPRLTERTPRPGSDDPSAGRRDQTYRCERVGAAGIFPLSPITFLLHPRKRNPMIVTTQRRRWKVSASIVALALGASVGGVVAASPASAVTLDGPTRACLEKQVGTEAVARIVAAPRLTAAQRKLVKACRRPAPSTGGNSTNKPVTWFSDGSGGWMTSGKPPACPAQIAWQLPIDSLEGVRSVLDAGQVRGGRYKGHGGFIMGSSDTVVRSPIDGYIVGASRYLERADGTPGSLAAGTGEQQIGFDIQNPCGIMVRFDHLKTLDPVIQRALAEVPLRDDSQGTLLAKPFRVQRGQVLATQVGYTETGVNSSFDFGTYDARGKQPNRRSEAELRTFGPDGQLGMYATCWMDHFGPQTAAALRALRPTGTQGSDVCS